MLGYASDNQFQSQLGAYLAISALCRLRSPLQGVGSDSVAPQPKLSEEPVRIEFCPFMQETPEKLATKG